MKQALVDGRSHLSYTDRQGDYINPHFANDATEYQRYVKYIVTNYQAQYSLNKVQEAELQLA